MKTFVVYIQILKDELNNKKITFNPQKLVLQIIFNGFTFLTTMVSELFDFSLIISFNNVIM